MFIIRNGELYTSNGGFDKEETPFIPFDEFIEDVCILPKDQFMSYIKGMMKNEISILPYHMKKQAVATLVHWRKYYDVRREYHIQNIAD